MNDKVKNLGQVFTDLKEVKLMTSMIQNSGEILEPSCGTGNFSNYLSSNNKACVSIEFDRDICPPYALNMDFFDYELSNKFNTIIGNPPYVAFKKIMPDTRSKLDVSKYDRRTNLHIFFIDKCLKHLKDNGELIFLTPRDFIKQTSASSLIDALHSKGTITHFYDYGDKILFKGFSPNCAIWRFEKDNFSHKTKLIDGSVVKQQNINGQFVFSNEIYDYDMSSLFDIRVGGVSGLDSIFVHQNGNKEFVYSKTASSSKTRKMYYNYKDEYIKAHEHKLRNRKIKTFNDNNWWHWGRDFHHSESGRIYVNCKTRAKKPFFTHDCKNYDGSVLALFIKNHDIDINKCVRVLNNIDWGDLGFKIGDRFVFNQKALQNTKLPIFEVDKFLNIGEK